MKILVIGSGGREHAIAWKLSQSPLISKIYIAPGNAGTSKEPSCENISIQATDLPGLLAFAQDKKIDLTVVGPEAPLVHGIVDLFEAAQLAIFGPQRTAAQLEGSKAFAKDFLCRHNIPTAAYSVHTHLASALTEIERKGAPIVIKCDGLAAGKGVVVAMQQQEAQEAVREMFAASPNTRVVIEEYIDGEEASFIVLVDGKNALPLATSQDHKRVGEQDTGPNTGGMGAYSPAPVITDAVHLRIMSEIIMPTIRGMAAEGAPFKGFLYAGLMIDAQGQARVIEFNVRLGDPEAQPLLMRLRSDLVELILAAQQGRLDAVQALWDKRPALGVVMAAHPYPAPPILHEVISGLDKVPDNCKVFHGGTALDAQQNIITNGGRVLCATALGESVAQAQAHAYAGLAPIFWTHMFYRRDIGWRAIDKEARPPAPPPRM